MAKVNIGKVVEILDKEVQHYDVPVVDLIKVQTNDPFKVLIATILSARTSDKTTAGVLPKLFEKVKTYKDFRKLSVSQIEKLIFPVGFYKNKAKYLSSLPDTLEDLYDGIIPETVDELVKLPGVGRKTANLVVAVGFEKPAICVDIHVHRINNRLGYVKTKDPLETEMTLRKQLPLKYWLTFNRIFVAFGQNLCKPINPKCNECPIYKYCNRVNVKTKYN